MKKLLTATSMLCLIVMLFSLSVFAAKPYQTYTYSIDGLPLNSPDAYTPIATYDYLSMKGLKTKIDQPNDIVVDDEENVYIADSNNNRIVALDPYFNFRFEISQFVNDMGIPDELTYPQGLYVTNDTIYVCDTDANRIVTFDREGEFKSILPAPKDDIFDEGSLYKPVAVAVDEHGRVFVVSSTTYQGIIVLTSTGEFVGLVGAQKVKLSAMDIIWRRLMTDEMREAQEQNISTEFNNITIDDEGFIYVTTSSIKDSTVSSFLKSKKSSWKGGTYSPVKMLNASGTEIMRRNGFFPPAGEIQFSNRARAGENENFYGPSKLTDVAIGPAKTWSIIDEKRSKIFTYDFDGNLLFAFGDIGDQLGTVSNIRGIAYQGSKMLILDKQKANVTVYARTEYGDILATALEHQNNRQYDIAVDDWQEILKRNSNFDAAYIGIGQALYRNGQYEESLEYFRSAYDTENYSNSYKEIRTQWISKYILVLVAIIAVIIVLFALFLRYANKVNKRAATKSGKRSFKEELLYGFHLWFHPFDGFWDLKREKRGSMRAAMVYIAVTVVAFFYQAIGEGYVSSPQGNYTTIWSQALAVLVPVLLFGVANWCLTTLFNGEGSLKDIIIALSYSLLPLPIFIIPTTIYTNFALESELKIVNFLITLAFIWVAILIFFGMMVTHDYTMMKNVLTIVGTVGGMAFIMFLGVLFSSLLSNLISLVTNIITEISYRM